MQSLDVCAALRRNIRSEKAAHQRGFSLCHHIILNIHFRQVFSNL